MKTSPALNQFAWLFTRGDESVRMEIYELGDAFRLLILGPGFAQASHDFDSMSSLTIFVNDYQDRLRTENFSLHASAERRVDRASGGRADGPDRRRG
jgi:hypothetical protein